MSDLAERILDPTHRRANVRSVIAQLEECHARSIPVSAELARAIPIVCAKLVQLDSPRMNSAGAKLILAALKLNLDVFQTADKMMRLDNGLATENHSHSLAVSIQQVEGRSK